MTHARLAVDIGGTFTDLALEHEGRFLSAKVLTTSRAPEEGVMIGIDLILKRSGLAAADLGTIIHGTTLATNAIIERKGAKTGLIVTEGFRDSLEIAHENRFEQYDIFMDKPPPLVPRDLRLPVPERIEARGRVIVPLDEGALAETAKTLARESVTSVAIGFLHSYVNPAHERRAREVLSKLLPDLWITLSSEACPEMREYERWCTACANAYVQPLMDRYLSRLVDALRERGIRCPLFLHHVGGRAHDDRDRAPVSHSACRIRSRGGRDPCGADRRTMRVRSHPIVRHGRDHRKDLPDRRGQAGDFPQPGGGAAIPLSQRQRVAGARAGD